MTKAIESLNRKLIPKVTKSIESLNCNLILKVISNADAMESWTTKLAIGTILTCSILTVLLSIVTAVFLWKSRRDGKQKKDNEVQTHKHKEEEDDISTDEL
ncbi:hypothetical protein FF2_045987 [Malus domestica]